MKLTKQCNTCKENKSLSEFAYRRASKDKLQPYCKVCNPKVNRQWRVKKTKAKARQDGQLELKLF